MSKLLIIVASTRPNNVGLPMGKWFEGEAVQHGGFDEVELADLGEINLPLLDEPHHPKLGQYVHQHTRDWSAKVASADAFAVVMPEYNFGYNAPLKNALDYLHNEWHYKPVGFVSYGGVSAGTRAVQMIKQVVTTLRMTPLTEAVSVPFVTQFVNDDRTITPNETMLGAAKDMLDELVRTNTALQPLRTQHQPA